MPGHGMSRRTPHGTLRPLMRSTDGDLSPRHDPSSRASSRSTARCWSSGSTTERSRSIFTARARALGVTATRRSCCRANSVLGWVNAMPSAYAANHEARTGSLSTMSLPIAVPSPFVPVLPLRSLGRPPNGIGDIRPGGWPVHTATTGRRVRSPERRSPAATEETRWIAPMPARIVPRSRGRGTPVTHGFTNLVGCQELLRVPDRRRDAPRLPARTTEGRGSRGGWNFRGSPGGGGEPRDREHVQDDGAREPTSGTDVPSYLSVPTSSWRRGAVTSRFP